VASTGSATDKDVVTEPVKATDKKVVTEPVEVTDVSLVISQYFAKFNRNLLLSGSKLLLHMAGKWPETLSGKGIVHL